MNIINNCPIDKIADKEIEKCKKIVNEVLSNYDVDYEIVIEECGDHWIKVNNLDFIKDGNVTTGDYTGEGMFWINIKNNEFILRE
ncbi:MAG: hypothetical protein ACQERX_05980 [Bacillota bacterium]